MRRFERLDRTRGASLLDALLQSPVATPLVLDADRVVLHGAGAMGDLARSVLAHLGITVAWMMDRAARLGQTMAPDLKVYRPDDPALAGEKSHAVVLVTTVSAPFEAVRDELHAAGWQRVFPFYDFANQFADRHPLNNGWFAPPLTDSDRTAIGRLFNALSDDASRAHYLQFLAWRLRREDWVFEDAPVIPQTRFFIPEIHRHLASTEHCFVDAGAYDGRILKQLLSITGGRIGQTSVFEPDPDNLVLLHRYLETVPADIRARITVFPFALGAHAGLRPFAVGYGLMSRMLSETGTGIHTEPVGAKRLDDLDLPVSFAKFHLEGAEHAALEGAERTIRRHRPLIAATVYHNADGLFRTLTHLMKSHADYSVCFRLHSWCGTGATVYAIPKS